MERKRVSSIDVERIEEEMETIGGTFALNQVVEAACHIRDISMKFIKDGVYKKLTREPERGTREGT